MAEVFKIIDGLRYQAMVLNGNILHWSVVANVSNQNESIMIKDQIDGFPVKNIESEVFLNNNKLIVVGIPSSILAIKSNAFKDCQRLNCINIYTSTIDNELGFIFLHRSVFSGCHSLKSITTGVPLKLNGKAIFEDCMSLEHIGCDNRVCGDLYSDVFKNCWSLKKIHLLGDRCRIWSNSLLGCPNLQNVIIEASFVQCPKSILNILATTHITCHPESILVELAYTGAKISFIETENNSTLLKS